jgi:hypothetical protein
MGVGLYSKILCCIHSLSQDGEDWILWQLCILWFRPETPDSVNTVKRGHRSKNPSSQLNWKKGFLGVADEKYIVGDIVLICTPNLRHFLVFNNLENIRKGKEFYGCSWGNRVPSNKEDTHGWVPPTCNQVFYRRRLREASAFRFR